jgi:hypothetical protein
MHLGMEALAIIDAVLNEWRLKHALEPSSQDAEIANAVLVARFATPKLLLLVGRCLACPRVAAIQLIHKTEKL